MPITNIGRLRLLLLQGSPEQMGAEHGRLLREEIRLGLREFIRRSSEAFEVPYEWLKQEAAKTVPFIPETYIREMKALARASEVPLEDIIAANCMVDVDGCYTQQILNCCNFVLSPPATADGLFVHGRNLDFPPFGVLPRIATLIARMPDDGDAIPTLTISWAGFVGMLTGCSAARLTCAEVTSPVKEWTLLGCPISFAIRSALEHSSSLGAFHEHMLSLPRTSGFNLAVSDGNTRQGMALEMTKAACGRRNSRRGILVVDNVALSPKLGHMRLTYASGAFRHARVMQLVGGTFGRIDTETALSFLKDRYDPARGVQKGRGYNCICNEHTVHSVLFLPDKDRMLVSHGDVPAPMGEYVEVDLAAAWTALRQVPVLVSGLVMRRDSSST